MPAFEQVIAMSEFGLVLGSGRMVETWHSSASPRTVLIWGQSSARPYTKSEVFGSGGSGLF